MYSGLPTLTAYLGLLVALLANPKSAIFAILSLINILAGLRSLWRNPVSAITRNPFTMSLKIGIASSYGNFYLFFNKFSRSP